MKLLPLLQNLNIHFKSIINSQCHQQFVISEISTKPFPSLNINYLKCTPFIHSSITNSVMSETSLCILRLRPRLLDSSLKIWDWDWDFLNQSQILRLRPRLYPFGLKAWDRDWDHPGLSLSLKTKVSLISVLINTFTKSALIYTIYNIKICLSLSKKIQKIENKPILTKPNTS